MNSSRVQYYDVMRAIHIELVSVVEAFFICLIYTQALAQITLNIHFRFHGLQLYVRFKRTNYFCVYTQYSTYILFTLVGHCFSFPREPTDGKPKANCMTCKRCIAKRCSVRCFRVH